MGANIEMNALLTWDIDKVNTHLFNAKPNEYKDLKKILFSFYTYEL